VSPPLGARRAAPRALLVGLAACTAAVFAAAFTSCIHGAPRRIVVASGEIPSSLDPVRAASPAEENACELLFDGLVNVAAGESGAASPVLGLAESIDQDRSDRALYRITLREARWHDGRPLDSADVAASFAAYADPANLSPRREYLLGLVASIEPEGRRGVLVRFREPIAEFRAWYVLAFKIVPREYRGKALPSDHTGAAGVAFAAAPVGTGPFRFQSRRENEIAFAAENASWRGSPASAGIVLRRVAKTEERIRDFLRGKIDVIFDTGPLDRPELERAGDVMVQSYMPHAFYAVAVNLRYPLLAGKDARKALVLAINRTALLPGVTDQEAGVELNCGPFPDGLLTKVLPEYFHQGFPDRLPWSPSKAARLAASSGLASRSAGSEPSILKIAVPFSWGRFGELLASSFAEQLRLSHIPARHEVLSDDEYRASLKERDYQLALVLHEGYDNLFSGISSLYRSGSPENETGISDPELDKLLASRDSAVEVTAWLRDTLALHDLVSDLAPYVPLFTIEKDIFYRGLRGFVIASDNPFLTAERWSLAKP
jgi:peptide/nickel transport system substrate-binding protein